MLSLIPIRFGLFMATHPLRTVCVALVVCGALGSGLLFWKQRDDQDVWLPAASDLRLKKEWLETNFPARLYYETALIVGDNVLSPDVLRFVRN